MDGMKNLILKIIRRIVIIVIIIKGDDDNETYIHKLILQKLWIHAWNAGGKKKKKEKKKLDTQIDWVDIHRYRDA